MAVIDVWAQILTEGMARAPWLRPLLRWIGRPDEVLLPTVTDTLAAMDEADVDLALLSACTLLRVLTVGWVAGQLTGRSIGVLGVNEGPAHFEPLAETNALTCRDQQLSTVIPRT